MLDRVSDEGVALVSAPVKVLIPSVLALLIGALALGWPQTGMRCSFSVTRPTAPLAALPSGASPGLVRQEFTGVDFERRASRGIDAIIDRSWNARYPTQSRSFLWRGLLAIPRSGDWALGVTSEDGALLALDGWPVVSSWGEHREVTRWRKIHLEAGFHALHVEHFQRAGNARMRLLWREPGGQPGTVPAGALFHCPDSDGMEGRPGNEPPFAIERHPTLDFTGGAALLAPDIEYWDVSRWGHPAVVAPLAARWEADLIPDQPGENTLTLAGTGSLALSVDGVRVEKPPSHSEVSLSVSLGDAPAAIVVEAFDPGLVRHVSLRWRSPGGKEVPIPARCLALPDRRVVGVARAGALLVALCLAALAAAAAGGLAILACTVRRYAALHVWSLVMLVALVLRLHDYTWVPGPGDTDDELTAHMQGMCLTADTPPIGWEARSRFPVERVIPLHGRVFKIVAPLVLYPPAFELMIGAANRLAGASSPFEARMYVTRLVPIGLSLLTVALLWPAGRALGFSTRSALLATAFLATYPLGVAMHRLVKEENLLAPLFLILAWLLATLRAQPEGEGRAGIGHRTLIGVTIVLCILTKQTGLAPAFFAIAALVEARRRGVAALAILYGILGVALWIWYGVTWAGSGFFSLQRGYHSYASFIDALWPYLAQGTVTEPRVGNSWMLGLWMAFLLFAARARRHRARRLVVLAVVCHLLVLALVCPAQRNFGWYKIPLLPFLALAWGSQTAGLLDRFDPLRALLWSGLFVLPMASTDRWADSLRAGMSLSHDAASAMVVKAVLLGSTVPAFVGLCLSARRRRGIARVAAGVLLVVILGGFIDIAWRWGQIHPSPWPPDPTGLEELPL